MSVDEDARAVEARERFERDGYTVFGVGGYLDVDKLAHEIREQLAPSSGAPAGLPRNYYSGQRVQDGWTRCEAVRAIAGAPVVLEAIRAAYDREPFPFQTLNFFVGTEQPEHQDTIHFRSDPDGWMCGVWVALEDMDGDNGPLVYYPGSHKLPIWDLTDVGPGIRGEAESYLRYEAFVQRKVRELGLEGEELHAPKGTALIWHSNLLHGGRPIRDRSRTRLSQVTHYFFEGCTAFWTPLLSDLEHGGICYRDPIDVRSGRPRRLYVCGVAGCRGGLVEGEGYCFKHLTHGSSSCAVVCGGIKGHPGVCDTNG